MSKNSLIVFIFGLLGVLAKIFWNSSFVRTLLDFRFAIICFAALLHVAMTVVCENLAEHKKKKKKKEKKSQAPALLL